MVIGILGAGGHAKVIIDILLCRAEGSRENLEISLFDDSLPPGTLVNGYFVTDKVRECVKLHADGFVIAVGDNSVRKTLADEFLLPYATLIHPSAIIAKDVSVEEGTVVMAGAIINSGSVIGKHCIVNTAATIDHDNVIHDFVHISPGAHLGGTVEVGDQSWIGIGSCVKNNVAIGKNCVVGAGAVVIRNLTMPGIYCGNPAKMSRIKRENGGFVDRCANGG